MPKKSFTLIELLVVIAIIAILAGIVITVIDPVRQRARARDANRKKDLAIVSAALEQYYAENNKYPSANVFTTPGSLTGTPQYIKSVPTGQTGAEYCYTSVSPYQNYVMCAPMEVGSNELNGYTACSTTAPTSGLNSGTYCTGNPF